MVTAANTAIVTSNKSVSASLCDGRQCRLQTDCIRAVTDHSFVEHQTSADSRSAVSGIRFRLASILSRQR